MSRFAHTPYSSGKPPFSIGLAPLDLANWIEADASLAEQLALKQAILADELATAFGALDESAAGQGEVLELLAPFGLDASDPAFWQIGLSLIERMIVELEAMG